MMSKRRIQLPVSQLRGPYGPWQAAFSVDALRRAWMAVRANRGGSGGDGETIAEFEGKLEKNLHHLHDLLLDGRYQPQPVKQILVPKSREGWRPVSLWAIRDRVVQRAAYNYLEPVFEQQFLPCSYGFRSGRSTRDAAEAVMQARQGGACWVLDADIKDCFGQMKNGRLLKQLSRWRVPKPVHHLIRLWLETKIGNAWRPDQTGAGTSQGGVISPLLCNLYLHAFDTAMQKPGLYLVRYADDFVIMGRREKTIHWAQKWASLNLHRIGLEMHPEKTRITTFEEGFRFVGWFFVKNDMYQLK